MKKVITLLNIILIFSFHSALASHWAGADLSYRCIGGNDYELILSFYRDCSGVPEPGQVMVWAICTQNSAFNFSVTLQKDSLSGAILTPTCHWQASTCTDTSGSAVYGIREFIYRAYVTLPPCINWKLSANFCCRNPSNTIFSSTNLNGYVESKLNNVQAPCNSSPVFLHKPQYILYSDPNYFMQQCLSFGGYDPDGDSLFYELTTPKASEQTNVNYLSGYSYLNPFMGLQPILDHQSGLLCLGTSGNIITPLAVLVEQWRTINGTPVRVGTSLRDAQSIVIPGTTNTPVLGGIDFLGRNEYHASDTITHLVVYVDSLVNFTIWGFDADTFNAAITGRPERFSISWNNDIPTASMSFLQDFSETAHAEFSWTPDNSNLGDNYFTLKIQDFACPYYRINYKTYCLTVKNYVAGVEIIEPVSDRLVVAPNPAPDGILRFHLKNSKGFRLEIYSMNGSRLSSHTIKGEETEIDMSQLKKGVYVYKIYENDRTPSINGKFVVGK